MNKKEREKTEKKIGKEFGKQRLEKEKRLDNLVDMQRNLYLTKVGYYIFSTIALVLGITIIKSLVDVSFVEGLALFLVGFLGLRYILLNKILLKIYNKHAEKMYKKK